MKEFEKWWLHFEPQIDPNTYNMDEKEIRKDVAECTHRAALEWVINNRKPYYDINDKKVVATDSDIIYKELEE